MKRSTLLYKNQVFVVAEEPPAGKGGSPDELVSDTKQGLSKQQQIDFINHKTTRTQRYEITKLLSKYKTEEGFRVRAMDYLRYDGTVYLEIGYTVPHHHGPYVEVVKYSIGKRGKVTKH
jgi:hypothetical protein